MGKKRTKGVTFKLVWEGNDDPTDTTSGRRVFQLVDSKSTKDNEERNKILKQFTKEDLGLVKPKKDKAAPKEPTQKDVINSHVKGRDDLWITHIMRMRRQQEQQQEEEEDDDDDEEENKRPVKKATGGSQNKKIVLKGKNALASHLKEAQKPKASGDGEDDEWESCEGDDEEWEDEDDEDDVEYEIEEREEEEGDEEYHFDDEDEENAPELVPMNANIKTITFEDKKPEKEETKKADEEEEEEIDLTKVEISKDVKTQRFDEYGLPMGAKYDYKQHIADANSGGAPTFSFTAKYDKVPELAKEIDIPVEKMNEEEREIFDALEFQGEDNAYEELEDDFLNLVNDGKKAAFIKEEKAKKEEKSKKEEKKKKNVDFGEDKIIEISTSKKDNKEKPAPKKEKKVADVSSKPQDSIMSNPNFKKVLEDTVRYLRDKHKDEREKNRQKYGDSDSDEYEDEDEHLADKRFDRSAVDNLPVDPKKYVEKLEFERDYAAQLALEEEDKSEGEEEEFDDYYRNPSEAGTRHTEKVSCYTGPTMSKTRLNIVTEAKPEQKPSKNGDKAEEDHESDDEGDEEDEDGHKQKKEETFNKRKKGETKEEKKARKEMVKQFKQERKEKKKKFKEEVDSKLKFQKAVLHKQNIANIQGYSVYKL